MGDPNLYSISTSMDMFHCFNTSNLSFPSSRNNCMTSSSNPPVHSRISSWSCSCGRSARYWDDQCIEISTPAWFSPSHTIHSSKQEQRSDVLVKYPLYIPEFPAESEKIIPMPEYQFLSDHSSLQAGFCSCNCIQLKWTAMTYSFNFSPLIPSATPTLQNASLSETLRS